MPVALIAPLLPLLLPALLGPARAAPGAPTRQVPAEVLVELRLLENRFELALAADCAAERCFSRGCSYLEHAVADQPQQTSLPGLGEELGPGSVAPQAWLTRAQCSFAHEQDEQPGDVQALVRRLETRLSSGFTVVSVDHQALAPLPPTLRTAPAPEEPAAAVAPTAPVPTEPAPLSATEAQRQAWETLLPHASWMLGIVLGTLAGTVLIWAWRRVGRGPSGEEIEALDAAPTAVGAQEEAPTAAEADARYVAEQEAAWAERLRGRGPQDPELQALARALLRAEDLPLLARAALRFPEHLPAAIPTGPEHARARLRLAEHLQRADPASLVADAAFYRALQRHALAAAVTADADAALARSLREDFGPAGLADLVDRLPPRLGALVLALSSPADRPTVVRLLGPARARRLVDPLLRSDRLSAAEARRLSEVLRAARDEAPLPPLPPSDEVSDRGATFDAAATLGTLLAALPVADQHEAFAAALARSHGALPPWQRQVVTAAMVATLPAEARLDLLLEVPAGPLSAWLSAQDERRRAAVLDQAPAALRAALQAAGADADPQAQAAAADEGARAVAAAYQAQLARLGLRFEEALAAADPAGAQA
ncbi:hypothetical protein L6R53_26790 [Myxococcota bacterium]|nr:hypothetical protein [Myxococcota bacterium]